MAARSQSKNHVACLRSGRSDCWTSLLAAPARKSRQAGRLQHGACHCITIQQLCLDSYCVRCYVETEQLQSFCPTIHNRRLDGVSLTSGVSVTAILGFRLVGNAKQPGQSTLYLLCPLDCFLLA